jgi:hypothetical protein
MRQVVGTGSAPVGVLQVLPLGVAVAVYLVIAEAPTQAGAVHDTCARALPGTAMTDVGAPGTAEGVTGSVWTAGLSPLAFLDFTENVYSVSFASPGTVQARGSASAPTTVEQVAEPGEAFTV